MQTLRPDDQVLGDTFVVGHVAVGVRLPYHGSMPTVLRVAPFRFFFYSGDGTEPPHIHVERDDCAAKFWLDPVRLERSRGFRRKEMNRIVRLVEEQLEQLLESWNEFFRD